ncbi:response regulator transcription factor [Aliarcobacter cryaerophilus]|uniref:DNA-binding response regulator n=1 Tax=Aliarcobacter cryaerophilus TaxID=28198 RepID=A0A2S9TP40_9BACT|nr:response regulator transcription factor [Aliarcobacter cryaerophilus]PRN00563.1 DNA-binding response regulator [Arcobacter cryaerophilus gv. pseudocryaerophilus]
MQNINLLKNMTLLLVEDDEELRNSIKELLSIFFKNIFVASNGLEALEIYSKNSINLIITDYVMPIMNGCDFCKEIRQKNKKIPLVIMSNYSDKEKLLKSISLELTDYLIKPLEYKQLLETLLKMIEKLERENLLSFKINEDREYNFFTKEIYDIKEQKNIKLAKSEIIILELLINNINKTVSIEEIEFNLSPNEHKSEQAIKNIMHRLRIKLAKNTIHNIQGIGYIFKSNL